MSRELTFALALHEALDLCLERDPGVYVMGLGVPDPKGTFGTTLGLQDKYGPERVLDMPCAENGMTGVAIGSALAGMRPVMVHQRIDFALLAVEQLVNQAAKWHYMFAGKLRVPLVVRLVVGRGWGQGPQHSQSLQALFAHVPGLQVVMPVTAHDAKGLLIACIEDDNPVLFIEHRWLHNLKGTVPEGVYRVPLGKCRLARPGKDLTIVACSYCVVDALRAAEALARDGIQVEVIDVRSLRPLDDTTIIQSVEKTGRLLVLDTGWKSFGVSAEIVARVTEKAFPKLRAAPERIALPECPTPTTPALADHYYPLAEDVEAAVRRMLRISRERLPRVSLRPRPLDVPDATFTGPF
jgi:acetoin:2,6-dichlorophenolindophenol oxidoreductase subunit beta